MSFSPEQFARLLLLASRWVEEQEQEVLRMGDPLDADQLEDARRVGVAEPKKVRVLLVPQIPLPEHPELRALCDSTGALGPNTSGLCARYGIFVRVDRHGKRETIVHELVHTTQYERLGGIQAFLQPYLNECVTVGYPQGPMEQEAIRVAAKICGSRK